jgi:hypothetical protein
MTTTATSASASALTRIQVGRHDRLFYGGMAAALGLTILGGFASTYYLRFFADGPRTTFNGGPFTAVVHLHGALFTAWVILFGVQTALIASHQVAVHRRMGVAGAVLAVAMVGVGSFLAIATASRGAAPPGMDPLAFLAIPMFDMVLFSTFVGSALALRRDRETHKRLMLLAYISIIVPAIARLPGVFPLLGPPGAFGMSLLFVVAAVVYDFVSRRRVHRAYVIGGAMIVLSVPLRFFISGTDAWRLLAKGLVG